MATLPSDYFNRFAAKKNYAKHLFIADRPLQSSELNEIQDQQLNNVSTLSGFLVGDGAITDGADISALGDGVISITEGTLIYAGMAMNVPAVTDASFPTAGEAVLGVSISDKVITYLEDPELLMQYQNSPSYGSAGADRLQKVTTWLLADDVPEGDTFFPVFYFKNGVLVKTTKSRNDLDQFSGLLGRYDSDTHGNYVLDGLTLSYAGIDGSTQQIMLNMSAGKARVLGNEALFAYESTVRLDPINDTGNVASEPYVFTAGTYTYQLRYSVIDQVTAVSGTKQVTRTVTHGSATGSSDLLPDTPVLQIISVQQGGTVYVKGSDYVQNGDSVDWSPTGNEPSPGSTYQVTYQYIDQFIPTWNDTSITISTSDALVSGSTFYVTYSYFLSRYDRVSIDASGAVQITKGIPAILANAQLPGTSATLLSIATVRLTKGQDPVINNDRIEVVTYNELKDLMSLVSDMQYNIAQLSLRDETRSTDPTTTKKGVVVDSLLNGNMRDAGLTNNAIIDDGQLFIGASFSRQSSLAPDGIMLSFTDTVIQSQEFRTKDTRINPYAGSGQVPQAMISVSPAKIDTRSFWSYFHGGFLPVDTTITIKLSGYAANEQIDLTFRNLPVVTLTADDNGAVQYAHMLSGGLVNGTYQYVATGKTTKAITRGTVTIYNSGKVDYGQNWTGGAVPWGYDPVAQTFTIQATRDINAVSIYLTELPTNTLQIKLVPTLVGIPNSTQLYGFGEVPANKCVLGWNKINLRYPVTVTGGTEYAIIVATANYQGKVATAKINGYDPDKQQYVVNQPAQGVLLTSANESTWSPVQDEDLVYRLHAADYSSTRTVNLGSVTVASNTNSLSLTADIETPANTSVRFYLTNGTDNINLNVNSETYTENFSGTFSLMAEFNTGDPTVSPKVFGGVIFRSGTTDTPGVYTQRQFSIPNGNITPVTLNVILDQYVPSGASVTVQYQKDSEWVALSGSTGTALGDGWYTVPYKLSGVNVANTRIRITLSLSNPVNRPFVKNVRAYFS
ncbi:hypothetical protein [Escherichia phage vB_EcoM_IME392]|nr:hypothetical protein [Escherichia phage vB_EcoM_IME392]